MSVVLRAVDACSAVGRRRIFSGLTMEVRAGERLHLAGPNGSGKTTVLRCIGGTMPVVHGRIEVGGAAAGSMAARREVGVCIDPERGLYPGMTGHDNLLFAARLRMPARQVADAVALVEDELEITPFSGRGSERYSAGMRARVTVARALLGSPALLLMDEPTRSLDAAGRELFWAALARRPTAACVVVSHLPGDLERCDRSLDVATLGQGAAR